MSDRVLYCQGCSIKVAVIVEGSKIKKGMVVLCSACESMRKASDLANKTKGSDYSDFDYKDMFKDIFKGK